MQGAEDMGKVSVVWRGNTYLIEMNSGARLKDLGDELQRLTNVKAETIRLIVPEISNKGSKLLSPYSYEHSCITLQEASVIQEKSIRMMGVAEDEIDRILQTAKIDQRIAGFDEEERRLRQRRSYGSQASLKLPQGQYIFCDFRTLEIPGLKLNPLPSEALKIMHRLAADPGIVAIMNKHRWRVGIMTEMAPVGYVGVSPKCILGFNKNQGEEISLRLRTDDLKGFRKFDSIKKTLLHELAHMVHTEHDDKFYSLDRQLNQEADNLNWTKSKGYTLSRVSHVDEDDDDYFLENSVISSQKLGGNSSNQLESARVSSAVAAYHRLANASASIMSSEVHVEPDPDDSVSKECDKPKTLNSIKSQEPDPDDHSLIGSKFEPDPDDSAHADNMVAERDDSRALLQPNNLSGRADNEPDPDEKIEAKVNNNANDSTENSGEAEPDPDDSEHDDILVAERDDSGALFQSSNLSGRADNEPDPDDKIKAKVNNNAHDCTEKMVEAEPDPDDTLIDPVEVSTMQIAEMDIDDQECQRIQDSVTSVLTRLQKAIQMLRAEVNPNEVTTVLQTLSRIIRNANEHPHEVKFKRLRKANPLIQRNIINYKAPLEILSLIGFSEELVNDESYLVLKRNDPGLLWLAKSTLETHIA